MPDHNHRIYITPGLTYCGLEPADLTIEPDWRAFFRDPDRCPKCFNEILIERLYGIEQWQRDTIVQGMKKW